MDQVRLAAAFVAVAALPFAVLALKRVLFCAVTALLFAAWQRRSEHRHG